MTDQTVTDQTETTPTDVVARLEALEGELARLKVQVGHASAVTDRAHSEGAGSQCLAAPEASASRRDLLRYGAVALGAAAAGLAVRPAEAADGNPVLIGSAFNQGTQDTWVESTGVNTRALLGWASASSGSGTGVQGHSNASIGTGVFGVGAAESGFNIGVLGESNSPAGIGAEGVNYTGGIGVRGSIPGNVTAHGIAVYGLNNSTHVGPSPGAGGFGVYGFCAKGHGLVGATGTAGGAAVAGATNGVAGAYAGVFYGPVVVTSSLTVLGAKSAAVPHPDGSRRLVYCVESPESWFEDFGSGTLACGRAEVTIDPDFAALTEMDGYQVFLTGYDHDHVLHVTNRTPCGFRVLANLALAALQGKQEDELSGTFGWRIVAKRKDITGERLATVTIPRAPKIPPSDQGPHRRPTSRTPTGR